MSEVSDESFNERFDKVNAAIEADPAFQEEDTPAETDPISEGEAKLPKEAIGEDQEKTSDEGKDKPPEDKPPGAIEPPVSWPADDKEAFKSLPTWTQERIVARENEREAHFAERSRTIAAREKDINDIQTRTAQAQERYNSELQRLNQIATQLMPAKFSDINSEADYLRLKVEDPARASEYEAFVQVLRNAQVQQTHEQQHKLQAHIDNEWNALQSKFPEFKDPAKGVALLNDVRKAAVEYYGFSQAEVQIIADHRHVPIIRDAIAWRNHQANLKAAEGKKVAQQPPSKTLRTNGAAIGANLGAEQKTQILNRAGKENDLRKKADMIARML